MADILDICSTVDLQDLPFRIIEVDMQDFPTMTIDQIDFWDLECMPQALCKTCRRPNIRRVYVRRRYRLSRGRQL